MQGVETSLGYGYAHSEGHRSKYSHVHPGRHTIGTQNRQAWEVTQQDTGQFLPVSSPVSSGSSQASDIPFCPRTLQQ